MTEHAVYVSLHEQRIQLVAAALRAHSDLSEQAAREAATHAVSALDHIPEKVR